MKSFTQTAKHQDEAFTRLDLLMVLVCLTLLAALVIPTHAKTESRSEGLFCTRNLKQLIQATLLYATDNRERLPGSYTGGHAQNPTPNDPVAPWAVGWLDWETRADNTNIQYLVDRRYTKLAAYFGNDARIFKCPADNLLSLTQRKLGWTGRVRSVSLNILLGEGNAEYGPMDMTTYSHPTRLYQLTNPKPAETLAFLDEHPDSINDPAFFPPYKIQWIDLPASYHDGAGSFAFADGHTEIHKWVSSVNKVPIQVSTYGGTDTAAGDPDIQWVRHRTPRLPGNNE